MTLQCDPLIYVDIVPRLQQSTSAYLLGHLSDLPALCKWFGASANANLSL